MQGPKIHAHSRLAAILSPIDNVHDRDLQTAIDQWTWVELEPSVLSERQIVKRLGTTALYCQSHALFFSTAKKPSWDGHSRTEDERRRWTFQGVLDSFLRHVVVVDRLFYRYQDVVAPSYRCVAGEPRSRSVQCVMWLMNHDSKHLGASAWIRSDH